MFLHLRFLRADLLAFTHHHGSLSVTSVAYSLVRISGLVGHALTASIHHGDHHDQWIRSVALSINRRRTVCDSLRSRAWLKSARIRSDPNRSWEDRQPLRFTASHLLLRGTSTYWLTVGLARRRPSLSLTLSRGFHHKAELEFPLPTPSARATIQWKKVGFAWPVLFRESTSLLLATKKKTPPIVRQAGVLSTSWKVTRDVKLRAGKRDLASTRALRGTI